MNISSVRLIACFALFGLYLSNASCAATSSCSPARAAADAKASSSAFGFDLYRAILGERPGENVFISPASVGFALAMTYNGAAGPTREAMAAALRLSTTSLDAVNRTDSTLIARMNEPIERVRLSVANSLWARRGLRFKSGFLERNARFYGADIESIDFKAPGAAGEINAWVSEKTNGTIPKIVDVIDPASILFLIDAIYFKGAWTHEFDPKLTHDGDFYTPGGAVEKRPMMDQRGEYLYLKGDGFQAASLPYGDGRTSMYLFLPDDRAGLGKFNRGLTAESWDSWVGEFSKRKGRIVLPRFKVEFTASLKPALTALGMGDAFDGGRANFSGMIEATGANVFIHDVMHKTYVAVDEEGTEAAAVTSVEMRLTSVSEPENPFEMICDHPFFIAIRDNETGLVLFMGSIVNPR
jgi:serine protease inhibitor